MIKSKKDELKSSIDGKTKIYKNSKIFHALGDIDELGCNIGLARELLIESEKKEETIADILGYLNTIQIELMSISSYLIDKKEFKIEDSIKNMDNFIKDNNNNVKNEFIIIGHSMFGMPNRLNKCACSIHICRAIARRVERYICDLAMNYHKNIRDLVVYFNRLSSYLFTIASTLDDLA